VLGPSSLGGTLGTGLAGGLGRSLSGTPGLGLGTGLPGSNLAMMDSVAGSLQALSWGPSQPAGQGVGGLSASLQGLHSVASGQGLPAASGGSNLGNGFGVATSGSFAAQQGAAFSVDSPTAFPESTLPGPVSGSLGREFSAPGFSYQENQLGTANWS
jgi:hypothetical protein